VDQIFGIFVFCCFVKIEIVFVSLLRAVGCVILLLFTGVRRGSEFGVVCGVVCVCASFVWSGEFGWVEVCSAREGDGVVMCVGLFWVVAGFVGRERDVGQCACEQGVLRGWRSRCCLGGSVV
jgi:hypothetical protein